MYFFNPTKKLRTNIWEVGDEWLYDIGKHCTFIIPKKEIKKQLPGNDRIYTQESNVLRQYSLMRYFTPHNLQFIENASNISEENIALHRHKYKVIKEKGLVGISRKEDCLQFMIKLYDDGFGSQFMHQIPIFEKINIYGPFGIGLCITPDWLQKYPNPKVVAFSGGTAINIFFDLIYYMWCFTFSQARSKLTHDFTFTLYAGFKSEEDAYGNDLLFKLLEKNPSKFKLHLYFTNKKTRLEQKYNKRFDQNYITSTFPTEVDRVWIRGPLQFEKSVLGILEQLGVPSSKVIEL